MRRKLGLLLLLVPIWSWAQFEEGDEGAASDTDIENEMAEAPEPTKIKVDSKDIKALADARQAKSEEALVTAASRILGVDPNHLEALNTLGVYYFENGKFGLARIIFLRALQSHPEEPALHNNLGVVYLAEGKQRLGVASIRKSLDLKNSYRIGAANLGSILLEYKDFSRALSPLEAGYKIVKSDLKGGNKAAIEVSNNYAVALAGAGKLDDAREIYEEILKNDSRQPAVLLNYAILLVDRLKDYKEGRKVLSRIKFAVEDGDILKRVRRLEETVNANEK